MIINKKRIGLSLSGGGYRASAFHLGTLKKLHELGILDKVEVISTISGGSITGAAWCLHEGEYNSFHNEMILKLKNKNVIRFIFRSWVFIRTILFAFILIGGAVYLSFTNWSGFTFPVLILFFYLFLSHQFKIFPVSKVIERAYDDFFYKGKTLKDLKIIPLLAIGSSNLHSGRHFTFSKISMSDSSYGSQGEYNPPIKFNQHDFPVSRAVMASSCVPFAFTPVRINKEFFLNEKDYYKINPVLVDGGVYDNQGIHKLTQEASRYECDIIITSDAGGKFIADKKYPNALALLIRTVDLFMYRIKGIQMIQHVYRNVQMAAKPIAYFSLGWRIQNAIPGFVRNMCEGQVLQEVIDAHGFEKEWIENPKVHVKELTQHLQKRLNYFEIEKKDLTEKQWEMARNTGTNLSALSGEQVEYLIRHAENLTELQVKLYCPKI